MTPFCFVVATAPLALYWIALSWAHRRPTPLAVDGRRDFLALSTALSGVFFIGPGWLTAPYGAMIVWGGFVWILCGLLYFCVVLWLSSFLRPRVVVYNATKDQLRKALTSLALALDDEARWAGAALNLPGLGVQFYIEDSSFGAVASLVGVGSERNAQGWRRLERELTSRLKQLEPTRRRAWLGFAALGVAFLALDAVCFFLYGNEIAAALRLFIDV